VPRFATTDLTGRAVQDVTSRGKHILARVDGGVTIHTHLRMDGSWRIRPAGGYPPRDHRVRLVLANQRWQAVGYLLGVVEVLPTASEDDAVGHLGPDLLGPDWDRAEAVRRLRADPGRAISEALLDQRNLAGIGNFYKSEVLFLRGVSPWRQVGDAGDLDAMVELARRLLDANKDRATQVTTGNPARGHQSWVYGRAGQACRRCGTLVRTATAVPATAVPATAASATAASATAASGTVAASAREASAATRDRVTFWCPACQPG
jgi:endonuclease-8